MVLVNRLSLLLFEPFDPLEVACFSYAVCRFVHLDGQILYTSLHISLHTFLNASLLLLLCLLESVDYFLAHFFR
jgi:hypothetical protein